MWVFVGGLQLPSKRKREYNDQISSWAAGKAALNKWQEESFKEEHRQKIRIAVENAIKYNDREERLCKLKEKEVLLRIQILELKRKRLELELKAAFNL